MPDTATETNPDKIDIPDTEIEATNENETVQVLKEIKERLAPKETVPAQPTRDQVRQAMKEQTGFTDAQLDLMEQREAALITQAVTPLQEKLAWSDIRSEHGGIDEDIEKDMKEELSQYPAARRGDKILLEKIYYMALGKKTKFSRPVVERTEEAARESNVVTRRVVSSNQGSSVSLGTGSAKKLNISSEEMNMADRMKMSHSDYVKYRDSQNVEDFREKK